MTTIYVTGQCLLTEIRSLRGRMQLAELSHNVKMRLMKALMRIQAKALVKTVIKALMKMLIQVLAASLTLSLKITRYRNSKTSNTVQLTTS